MSWCEELKELVNSRQWDDIYLYAVRAMKEPGSNVQVTIEAIFLLFDSLVYKQYSSQSEYDKISDALRKLFAVGSSKFQYDPKYLFFVGYFIALAEWAFGQDDLTLSYDMLRRAAKIDSTNILYEWGYRFSTNDPLARLLTGKLFLDKNTMEYLASLGEAGKLIAEAIETDYKFFRNEGLS